MRREYLAVCPKGHRNYLILYDIDPEPGEVGCTTVNRDFIACRLPCRVQELSRVEKAMPEPPQAPEHDETTCQRPLGACEPCAAVYGLVRYP